MFVKSAVRIYRLLNFNMLFQLVLTTFLKNELFSCFANADHVMN